LEPSASSSSISGGVKREAFVRAIRMVYRDALPHEIDFKAARAHINPAL
jgi:hypothetical protein